MLIKDNLIFRNLEEQVRANKENIELMSVLNHIIGKGENRPETANNGDIYLYGYIAPYTAYIYTDNGWKVIGTFPAPSTVPGPVGATGPQGQPGIGISEFEFTTDGDLYIILTDGKRAFVGNTKGPKGDTGPRGPEGPQGPQGPRGFKGDRGETGYGYYIEATLSNEGELPNPSSVSRDTAFLIDDELYVLIGTDELEWYNVGPVGQIHGAGVEVIEINYPEGASTGMITSNDLERLLLSPANLILFANEIYRLADDRTDEGYLVYTHIGAFDKGTMPFVKLFTIMLNNNSWTVVGKPLVDGITFDRVVSEIREDLNAKAYKAWVEDKIAAITTPMKVNIDCEHRAEITGRTGNEAGVAIKDQQMILTKIEGRTLIKNQLIDSGYIQNGVQNGVEITHSDNGSIILNGTCTAATYIFLETYINTNNASKKFLMTPSSFSKTTDLIYYINEPYTVWTKYDNNKTFSTSSEQGFYLYIPEGAIYNNEVITPQLIDLTKMYGAGNEPTTTAEYLNDFPLYIPYTEGEFVHSNNTLKSTGKNIFNVDPKLSHLAYNATGSFTGNTITITSMTNNNDSKFIGVYQNLVPNTKYYFNCDGDANYLTTRVFEKTYGEEGVGLGLDQYGVRMKGRQVANFEDGVNSFTTTSNTEYFFIFYSVGTLPINQTSTIDNVMLSVDDNVPFELSKQAVIENVGELKKFDYIDNQSGLLIEGTAVYTIKNTSNIGYNSAGVYNSFFVADATNLFKYKGSGNISKYSFTSPDISFVYVNNYDALIINTNKDYTTLEAFKAAMNGVQIMSEAANPRVAYNHTPAGYAVYTDGQQTQDGTIPYKLYKQYSVSQEAQLRANIEMDRQQQKQLDWLQRQIQDLWDNI